MIPLYLIHILRTTTDSCDLNLYNSLFPVISHLIPTNPPKLPNPHVSSRPPIDIRFAIRTIYNPIDRSSQVRMYLYLLLPTSTHLVTSTHCIATPHLSSLSCLQVQRLRNQPTRRLRKRRFVKTGWKFKPLGELRRPRFWLRNWRLASLWWWGRSSSSRRRNRRIRD